MAGGAAWGRPRAGAWRRRWACRENTTARGRLRSSRSRLFYLRGRSSIDPLIVDCLLRVAPLLAPVFHHNAWLCLEQRSRGLASILVVVGTVGAVEGSDVNSRAAGMAAVECVDRVFSRLAGRQEQQRNDYCDRQDVAGHWCRAKKAPPNGGASEVGRCATPPLSCEDAKRKSKRRDKLTTRAGGKGSVPCRHKGHSGAAGNAAAQLSAAFRRSGIVALSLTIGLRGPTEAPRATHGRDRSVAIRQRLVTSAATERAAATAAPRKPRR
jgi:hypothetical protein